MLTRLMLRQWFPIAAFLGYGCTLPAGDDPGSANRDPRTFGAGATQPPASCAMEGADNLCTRCQKRSCCNEIAACTGDCRTWVAAFQVCLSPDGVWSGYGTAACKNEMALAARPAAMALVNCFATQCSDERSCGIEPLAVYSLPASAPTGDFCAAAFLENYCNGCHSPGKLGPTGEALSEFTSDRGWVAPLHNRDWLQSMDYAKVVAKKDIIACGVRADYLSTECASLSSVRSGFFTKPAKFPPSGIGGYATCPNALSTGGCPQPTPFERARFLSWIADGALR